MAKRGPKPKKRITLNCLICDKEFIVPEHNPKNQRMCSLSCSNVFNKKHDDVELKCKACGKLFIVPYQKRHRITCSRSCSSAGELNGMHGIKGKNHPNYGVSPWIKGKTTKTDDRVAELGRKISKKLKNKFESGEMSNSGINNPMYRKTHTKESREKMSKTKTEKIINGEYSGWFRKGIVYSKKMDEAIYVRSSWEECAIKFFDCCDNIVTFINEPFSIVYYYGKYKRRYIPDFLVSYNNGTKKLIEIKPSAFVNAKINKLKFAAARKYCKEHGMQFEVWTERDIEGIKND